MRTEKKIAIIVAVILVVFGIAMMTYSIARAGGNIMNLMKTKNYEEKTYDITENFDDIEIAIGAHDIQIEKSADKDTHFVCYETDNSRFDVAVNGRKLVIEQNITGWNTNIMEIDVSKTNVLYLPKDSYDTLTCSLGSGDICIDEKFSFGEMGFEVGSGDVQVNNAQCRNQFMAQTHSGDVRASQVTSEGSFYVAVGSGKIDLDNCDGVTIGLQTASGDIRLNSVDGTSITMVTGSGDIEGTLRSSKTFDAKAGSGDVSVPADSEGGTCSARTGSGDIALSVNEQ